VRIATFAVLIAAALAAGCPDRLSEDGALTPEGPGSIHNECLDDVDCVAVASTCCGCPAFALRTDLNSGCEAVMCPEEPAPSCPAVIPACRDHACTLVCAPIACDLQCADGFATDDAGCLRCECGAAPPQVDPQCKVDDDCVQVPADCCGCARGGADTAVPAAQVDQHREDLGCSGEVSCPGVDVCTPEVVPHCTSGHCVLEDVPTDDGPGAIPGTCGRPDLPACPEGTGCVLNQDDDATGAGLGSCEPRT
jgi:hypothetical protein